MRCKYSSIGCSWVGEFCILEVHEALCPRPKMAGEDLIDSVVRLEENKEKEMRVYKRLLELLSYEKLDLIDVKLCSHCNVTDPSARLYESSEFTAHNLTWVVSACIDSRQDSSTGAVTRSLGYKLTLSTKPQNQFQISYIMVRGPCGAVAMEPVLYNFKFSDDALETPFCDAPFCDPSDVNLLLASKNIHLRLVLIHVKK